jgi:hypothetical protein
MALHCAEIPLGALQSSRVWLFNARSPSKRLFFSSGCGYFSRMVRRTTMHFPLSSFMCQVIRLGEKAELAILPTDVPSSQYSGRDVRIVHHRVG